MLIKFFNNETIYSAPTLAVENLLNKKFHWKPLKNWCEINGIEIIKIPDERFGQVNSYPAQAWLEVYGITLSEIFDFN